MRTSNTRARKFSSTVGKIVMALVFASMIGGIPIAPAFGRYRHGGHHQHGRYEHGRYYSEPVYAPPPVVYTPDQYQSPGIGLAFPIDIGGGGGGYYGGGGHRGGHRGGGHRGGGRK